MHTRAAVVSLVMSASLAAQTQVPVWPREPDAPHAPRPPAPSQAQIELVGEYESAAGARLYMWERDQRLWTIIDRGEPQAFDPSETNVTRAGGRVAAVRVADVTF